MNLKKFFFNHNETLENTKNFVRPFGRVVSIVDLKNISLQETLIVTIDKRKQERRILIVKKDSLPSS